MEVLATMWESEATVSKVAVRTPESCIMKDDRLDPNKGEMDVVQE